MNHAEPVSRGQGWAVAAWTILVMAAVLGVASDQTSQLITSHFQFGKPSIEFAPKPVASVAKHAVTPYDTLPIILTIPFAVTRTQRMMVARAKHRAEFAHRLGQARSDLKAAPGLLAGLALMGVSSSNH
jgi:hypothetical protein